MTAKRLHLPESLSEAPRLDLNAARSWCDSQDPDDRPAAWAAVSEAMFLGGTYLRIGRSLAARAYKDRREARRRAEFAAEFAQFAAESWQAMVAEMLDDPSAHQGDHLFNVLYGKTRNLVTTYTRNEYTGGGTAASAEIRRKKRVPSVAAAYAKAHGGRSGSAKALCDWANREMVTSAYPARDGKSSEQRARACGAWFSPDDFASNVPALSVRISLSYGVGDPDSAGFSTDDGPWSAGGDPVEEWVERQDHADRMTQVRETLFAACDTRAATDTTCPLAGQACAPSRVLISDEAVRTTRGKILDRDDPVARLRYGVPLSLPTARKCAACILAVATESLVEFRDEAA